MKQFTLERNENKNGYIVVDNIKGEKYTHTLDDKPLTKKQATLFSNYKNNESDADFLTNKILFDGWCIDVAIDRLSKYIKPSDFKKAIKEIYKGSNE